MNNSNFKEVVRKINEKKILLPDFQREFVWKDEEQQRMIVASVLARMPIGSILLLESKPDEYSSKKIGLKSAVDTSDVEEKIEFLLDGQQRITVLTNVFSNTIFDGCEKISDLVSPSLKRRFFLRIPKWCQCEEEADIFGVCDLDFRYRDARSKEPEFLSGDILPFVECISFLNQDGEPYNPQVELSNELDNFCITYKKGYLIPLFLLISGEYSKNRMQITLHSKKIIEKIASNIGDEIKDYFIKIIDDEEKRAFIKKIFKVGEVAAQEYTEEVFSTKIDERQEEWAESMKEYLNACLEEISLNQIVVSEAQRARAIDIYENLNRGGISLNTFDLIMAKVAKVSKDNFYQRLVFYMQDKKLYEKEVVPTAIRSLIEERIEKQTYNATEATKCYTADKNEVSGKYIDTFLDVLSLYCNNKEFVAEAFKVDYMKRNQILRLEPNDIDENAQKVCVAIDRALFFFQTRCGIRSIQEINYALMLVLVATVFLNDEWFADTKKHNALEAWYWSVLFSGEFAKDQNTMMIKHLQMFVSSFQEKQDYAWITNIREYVLDSQNFSDERLLLMEKVDEDRYPKMIIRNFICQYLLAKAPVDVFEENKKISVFSTEANQLEMHHIIPLGSVKKVGESIKKLRDNPKHICNSPLNFVYITNQANSEISDEPIDSYVTKLNDAAKNKLKIPSYVSAKITEEEIYNILRQRYSALKGDLREHIDNLITMV